MGFWTGGISGESRWSPPAPMSLEAAERMAGEIGRACPSLRPVATPKGGLFSAEILSPELYPDDKPTRGFYVPVPPPPPFKLARTRLPCLVGESGGRQWQVSVMVPGSINRAVAPSVSVHTYVRAVRGDLVPFAELPWVVVAGPTTLEGVGPAEPARSIDFLRLARRKAVGHATLFLGRAPIPAARPPVQVPSVIEAWDAAAKTFFESSPFLQTYAGWEQRSRGGAARPPPVLELLGDRLALTIGVDPGDPSSTAQTVRELLEIVPRFEQGLTGRALDTDPIPTVTFREPPGSVPDLRPAYRCPKCGQMEILRRGREKEEGRTHVRTLNCGVDIFPPYPDRVGDVLSGRSGGPLGPG